jgi:DNA polymerase
MGRAMSQELKNNIVTILEFYKELGFERLPLNYSNELLVTSNIKDSNELKVTSDEHNKEENLSLNKLVTANSLLVTAFNNSSLNKEDALHALRNEIGDCQRCKLAKGRTNIVFGEGNANAYIMFIGEAPGKDEDMQARPFVGEAGQILTSLINNMGKASDLNFTRTDVYIANIVKCRPPMNRDPLADEIAACLPFLQRQIEIIAPKVIISLGKIAAHTLMGLETPLSKFSITKIRGQFFEYKGIAIMPTYHPAYFLRNPKDKPLTWSDAQAVLKRLKEMQ